MLKQNKDEMEKDAGFIPILRQTVTTSSTGTFDFKDHYIRGLIIAGEPLISKTSIYDESRISNKSVPGNNPINPITFESNTTRSYRHRLESCLINRKTKIYIIDEAPDMLKLPSGKKEKELLDVIKSICENSGIKILMSGTYALRRMLNLSDQLAARSSKPIHFRRYLHSTQSTDDGYAFLSILHTFEINLPLQNPPELMKLYDFMYERSLGCIGLLKAWVVKSLEEALRKNLKTIDEKLLIQYAPPPSSIIKIISEIIEGEKYIKEENSKSIWTALGIDPQKEKSAIKSQKTIRKKIKPFHRKPQRYPVGGRRLPS
jgi:hypothetical protein